jgi:Ca2+-binding RTX toxin-like protein
LPLRKFFEEIMVDAFGAFRNSESFPSNPFPAGPDLIALANGRILATWGSFDERHGQIFDAQLHQLSPVLELKIGDIEPLTSGGFLIVGNNSGQFYTANGVAAGNPFAIADQAGGVTSSEAAGALSDGTILVTYTRSVYELVTFLGDQFYDFRVHVVGQVFDAAGTATGEEFRVSAIDAHTREDQSRVEVLPNGNFLAVYVAESDQGSGDDWGGPRLRAQIIDPLGNLVGSEIRPQPVTDEFLAADVAILKNGDAVFVWKIDEAGDDSPTRHEMFLQLVHQDGSVAGGLIPVAQFAEDHGVSVVALDNGGFMVIGIGVNQDPLFSGDHQDDDPTDDNVAAQLFDAAGNRVGGLFEVPSSYFSETSAALLNGDVIINAGADGGSFELFDVLSLPVPPATIQGTNGNDVINSSQTAPGQSLPTHGADQIKAGNGDDTVIARGGNDRVYGEIGNDTLRGQDGDDYLSGGDGNDSLYGEYGNDTIYGGDGDDKLFGAIGQDILKGDAGSDTIYGGDDYDTLFGGNDNDVLYGEGGRDTLYGEAGDDRLFGGVGDDILKGGDGNDRIYTGTGFDRVWGGAGDDYIVSDSSDGHAIFLDGGDGNDIIVSNTELTRLIGGDGNDTLKAYSYGETVEGGAGDDTLIALYGGHLLDGGDGDDTLYGGDGSDQILAGSGNDVLKGRDGEDLLVGGIGDDLYFGGSGADKFVFGLGHGNDRVSDYEAGVDRFDLSALPIFNSFAQLSTAMAQVGSNVVITTSPNDSITIQNTTLAQLAAHSSDFLLS